MKEMKSKYMIVVKGNMQTEKKPNQSGVIQHTKLKKLIET